MASLCDVHQIERVLQPLCDLVGLYKARGPDFLGRAETWLEELQNALRNAGFGEASEIAALRGQVILAREACDACHDLPASAPPQERSPAAVLNALIHASTLANGVIAHSRGLNREAARIALQLVAAAQAKGVYQRSTDHTGVYGAIASDPDFADVCAHLTGIVGRADAVMLLAKALTYLDPASR